MADTKAVADLRALVRKYLDEIGLNYLRDADDDFVVPVGEIMIVLMPREWVEDQTVVVVAANIVENANLDESVYQYVNERNTEILFGKMAAYMDQKVVRFEHPLLGDFLNRAELEAAVKVVGATSLNFHDEVKKRWGGV